MSDPSRSNKQYSVPPPAPPLPPSRPGVLQRLVAPLGFGLASRPTSSHTHRHSYSETQHDRPQPRNYISLPSQTAAHKTGLPIAAVDINSQKTHAILAGKEILKTVRVEGNKITEDFNLRSKITSYAPAKKSANDRSGRRKEYLSSLDVKWSHGHFDSIIATAAENGRIALYDINKPEVELAWLHEHSGQIHRVAFDPHVGAFLLSGSHDGVTKLWDLRTLEKSAFSMKSVKQFQGRASAIRDVKWSPTDGVEFIACTDEGVIQKWDIRNSTAPVFRINGGGGKQCLTIDWHPDGRHVACGGIDKYLRIYDFHSDNRRQKPLMMLKTPRAIRNIHWRPACWSDELAGTGQWQSTQLATCYAEDDPRVHVWDLRRPHLAFREIARYNRPATDLLWASKNILWTVGNEGAFTQTDVSFAIQPHEELNPSTACWLPNNEYAVFAEEREIRRDSDQADPAIDFLGIDQERLSGVEGQADGESLSDDEAGIEGLLTTFRRRQSRAASSKSAKSRTSSPSYVPGMSQVLSLDKAVFAREDMFNNYQVGAIGRITGITPDQDAVSFLASAYAPASTDMERKAEPAKILERLEEAFNSNADTCDMVSLHRTAQSWRILSAVIVPELREWANKNRTVRLARSAEIRKAKSTVDVEDIASTSEQNLDSGQLPTDVTIRPHEPQKMTSSLLKGLIGGSKYQRVQDTDSLSNLATPMARPLPDSPMSGRLHTTPQLYNNDSALERMPPLPPSVVASLSTAEAASKALLDSESSNVGTPPSSPETKKETYIISRRHRRMNTSDSNNNLGHFPAHPTSYRVPMQPSDLLISQEKPAAHIQRQEDRRAALRDFRLQARPVLNLEESAPQTPSVQMTNPIPTQRHDSNESFTMFSASTDSSHKMKSLGGSFESPEKKSIRSVTSGSWNTAAEIDILVPSSPPSDESANQNHMTRRFSTIPGLEYQRNILSPVGATDSGIPEEKAIGNTRTEARHTQSGREHSDYLPWGKNTSAVDPLEFEDNDIEQISKKSTSLSSSPEEPFHFEHVPEVPAPQIHQINPAELESQSAIKVTTMKEDQTTYEAEDVDSDSLDFIYSDFHPIDFDNYDPGLPFAWSSLPLICQAIAFDIREGPACGQFSAHLLMHVHPFFFHQKFRDSVWRETGATRMVERLMHACSSARIIENILSTHYDYLKRLHLSVPMAELRKLCAEFDYPNIYETGLQVDKTGLGSGQASFLCITCASCHCPMQDGSHVCEGCRKLRKVCPVCLSLNYTRDENKDFSGMRDDVGLQDNSMWAYCHGCGHSAHFACMSQWLAHPYCEGICPSDGCGHDCGPGKVREERIARQAREEEESDLIRGGNVAVSKDDSWKAPTSAAVEKTRRVLRSGETDRGTQSGDERGSSASRSARANRSGLSGTSSRKSVRLVVPGEERKGGRS